MVGFLEKFDEISRDVAVSAIEECGGDPGVAGAPCTTDSMDVIVNVAGEIVIDDMGDVGDIETTSGDGCGDHDWCLSATEHFKGTFSFALSAISVDGGGGEVGVEEKVGQGVGSTFCFDKDEGETTGWHRVQDIEEDGTFVDVFDVLDFLCDVFGCRTYSTDTQEDVVFQEIAGEDLDIARKSCAEHECLTIMNARHVFSFDDSADLRFETHVEHSICFVENQEFDVCQTDSTTFDQIDQTTWRRRQQITTAFNLTQLLTNVGAAIDDAGFHPRTIGKFAGFIVDLKDEFSSGSED